MARLSRRRKGVLQQRLAGQGMEDLGKVRVHALALAGGQDNDLQGGSGRHGIV